MSAHWKNQVQASLMPSKDTVPIHRMHIWRTTRQAPGTSCMKVRLVWPRCFALFWYWSIDDQSITTQKSFIDWDRTSKQTSRTLPVRSSAIFRKPWGRNNSHPDFSAQRIYPVARVLELPTCPTLPFCVIINTQDVRAEALLNMRCIVKGYHLSCCCCLQFHWLQKYNFCYQNFSVKA